MLMIYLLDGLMRGEFMLKNKFLLFLLSIGLLFASNNYVYAQDTDDESDEEEVEQNTEKQEDKEAKSQNSSSAIEEKKEESMLDKLEKADLSKIDLFQVVSDMERKNMLIKLQMEQEKLQISLQRLKQEKESINAKVKEEKLKKAQEQREIDKKVAEENLARKKAEAEIEKTKMIEQRKQDLITSVARAFAENPNQDYSGLLSMIKAENNGVVPTELQFIEDKMKAMQAEERAKLAKAAVNSVNIDKKIALEKALEVYSIIGLKGELIATVKNKLNAQTFKVKEGTQISNGFVVSQIAPESVTFTKGNEVKTLYLNVN